MSQNIDETEQNPYLLNQPPAAKLNQNSSGDLIVPQGLTEESQQQSFLSRDGSGFLPMQLFEQRNVENNAQIPQFQFEDVDQEELTDQKLGIEQDNDEECEAEDKIHELDQKNEIMKKNGRILKRIKEKKQDDAGNDRFLNVNLKVSAGKYFNKANLQQPKRIQSANVSRQLMNKNLRNQDQKPRIVSGKNNSTLSSNKRVAFQIDDDRQESSSVLMKDSQYNDNSIFTLNKKLQGKGSKYFGGPHQQRQNLTNNHSLGSIQSGSVVLDDLNNYFNDKGLDAYPLSNANTVNRIYGQKGAKLQEKLIKGTTSLRQLKTGKSPDPNGRNNYGEQVHMSQIILNKLKAQENKDLRTFQAPQGKPIHQVEKIMRMYDNNPVSNQTKIQRQIQSAKIRSSSRGHASQGLQVLDPRISGSPAQQNQEASEIVDVVIKPPVVQGVRLSQQQTQYSLNTDTLNNFPSAPNNDNAYFDMISNIKKKNFKLRQENNFLKREKKNADILINRFLEPANILSEEKLSQLNEMSRQDLMAVIRKLSNQSIQNNNLYNKTNSELKTVYKDSVKLMKELDTLKRDSAATKFKEIETERDMYKAHCLTLDQQLQEVSSKKDKQKRLQIQAVLKQFEQQELTYKAEQTKMKELISSLNRRIKDFQVMSDQLDKRNQELQNKVYEYAQQSKKLKIENTRSSMDQQTLEDEKNEIKTKYDILKEEFVLVEKEKEELNVQNKKLIQENQELNDQYNELIAKDGREFVSVGVNPIKEIQETQEAQEVKESNNTQQFQQEISLSHQTLIDQNESLGSSVKQMEQELAVMQMDALKSSDEKIRSLEAMIKKLLAVQVQASMKYSVLSTQKNLIQQQLETQTAQLDKKCEEHDHRACQNESLAKEKSELLQQIENLQEEIKDKNQTIAEQKIQNLEIVQNQVISRNNAQYAATQNSIAMSNKNSNLIDNESCDLNYTEVLPHGTYGKNRIKTHSFDQEEDLQTQNPRPSRFNNIKEQGASKSEDEIFYDLQIQNYSFDQNKEEEGQIRKYESDQIEIEQIEKTNEKSKSLKQQLVEIELNNRQLQIQTDRVKEFYEDQISQLKQQHLNEAQQLQNKINELTSKQATMVKKAQKKDQMCQTRIDAKVKFEEDLKEKEFQREKELLTIQHQKEVAQLNQNVNLHKEKNRLIAQEYETILKHKQQIEAKLEELTILKSIIGDYGFIIQNYKTEKPILNLKILNLECVNNKYEQAFQNYQQQMFEKLQETLELEKQKDPLYKGEGIKEQSQTPKSEPPITNQNGQELEQLKDEINKQMNERQNIIKELKHTLSTLTEQNEYEQNELLEEESKFYMLQHKGAIINKSEIEDHNNLVVQFKKKISLLQGKIQEIKSELQQQQEQLKYFQRQIEKDEQLFRILYTQMDTSNLYQNYAQVQSIKDEFEKQLKAKVIEANNCIKNSKFQINMMKYQVEVMKGNKQIDKDTMLLNEESSQTEVSHIDLGEGEMQYDDEVEDEGEGEEYKGEEAEGEYYDEQVDYYEYYEEQGEDEISEMGSKRSKQSKRSNFKLVEVQQQEEDKYDQQAQLIAPKQRRGQLIKMTSVTDIPLPNAQSSSKKKSSPPDSKDENNLDDIEVQDPNNINKKESQQQNK